MIAFTYKGKNSRQSMSVGYLDITRSKTDSIAPTRKSKESTDFGPNSNQSMFCSTITNLHPGASKSSKQPQFLMKLTEYK